MRNPFWNQLKFSSNNAAVKASLRDGEDQGMYIGKNPEYMPIQASPLHPVVWVKTAKGVPFVRKERLDVRD